MIFTSPSPSTGTSLLQVLPSTFGKIRSWWLLCFNLLVDGQISHISWCRFWSSGNFEKSSLSRSTLWHTFMEGKTWARYVQTKSSTTWKDYGCKWNQTATHKVNFERILDSFFGFLNNYSFNFQQIVINVKSYRRSSRKTEFTWHIEFGRKCSRSLPVN